MPGEALVLEVPRTRRRALAAVAGAAAVFSILLPGSLAQAVLWSGVVLGWAWLTTTYPSYYLTTRRLVRHSPLRDETVILGLVTDVERTRGLGGHRIRVRTSRGADFVVTGVRDVERVAHAISAIAREAGALAHGGGVPGAPTALARTGTSPIVSASPLLAHLEDEYERELARSVAAT